MKYSPEKKAQALAIATESTAKAASEQLGISYATMLNWIKEAKEQQAAESQPVIAAGDVPLAREPESVQQERPRKATAKLPEPQKGISSEEQVRMLEKDYADLLKENQRLKNAITVLIS